MQPRSTGSGHPDPSPHRSGCGAFHNRSALKNQTAGEGLGRFTTEHQGPSAQLQNFVATSGNRVFGHFIVLKVGKSKDRLQGVGRARDFQRGMVTRPSDVPTRQQG